MNAARVALERGDVIPVLAWISAAQEAEVRAAFADAVVVRKAGGRTRDLADRYFFETLVRLHRASEGEAYSGLKPADAIDEQIAAADRSLEGGSVDRLADTLSQRVAASLRARFAEVLERRAHAGDGVDAGRAYVKAYVAYIHYAEELGALAAAGVHPGQIHER